MAMATWFDRGLSVVVYRDFWSTGDLSRRDKIICSLGGGGNLFFYVTTRQNNLLVGVGANFFSMKFVTTRQNNLLVGDGAPPWPKGLIINPFGHGGHHPQRANYFVSSWQISNEKRWAPTPTSKLFCLVVTNFKWKKIGSYPNEQIILSRRDIEK